MIRHEFDPWDTKGAVECEAKGIVTGDRAPPLLMEGRPHEREGVLLCGPSLVALGVVSFHSFLQLYVVVRERARGRKRFYANPGLTWFHNL